MDITPHGYSGYATHKQIDALITRASKLRIITPYIDKYYADRLANESLSKPVYLITSGNPSGDKRTMKILKSGNRKGYAKTAFYAAIPAALVVLFNIRPLFKIVLPIAALIIVIMTVLYTSTRSKVIVKTITGPFVHEKIYLSETAAIVGSVNLTFKGTHSNIEHIEVITDPVRVAELRRHFNKLWNNGY